MMIFMILIIYEFRIFELRDEEINAKKSITEL